MSPRTTEAEIQAEFYYRCRRAGIGCRLEFYSRVGILDALIVAPRGKGGLIIVECKRDLGLLCPLQLQKYSWLKLPILTLCRKEEIPRLLKRIQSMVKDGLEPIAFDVLDGTAPL